MHPEDFRASMLKKMGSTLCCSDDDIINIRAHYYAMILEVSMRLSTLWVLTSGVVVRPNDRGCTGCSGCQWGC